LGDRQVVRQLEIEQHSHRTPMLRAGSQEFTSR
jgi:hypothetical protein